jgi:hypothetical protein
MAFTGLKCTTSSPYSEQPTAPCPVHQEATRTAERVGLPGKHTDGALFTGAVRARQFEGFAVLAVVDITHAIADLCPDQRGPGSLDRASRG